MECKTTVGTQWNGVKSRHYVPMHRCYAMTGIIFEEVSKGSPSQHATKV